jgi:hypothetical protein
MTSTSTITATTTPPRPKNAAEWSGLIDVKDTAEVPVDFLVFDQDNPRFTPDKRPEDATDAAIIAKLASTADLAELIQSIATSGYINIEPLIVVLKMDRLVVLEGNRRLAAIKCLRDPETAIAARVSTPPISEKVRSSLEAILVYRVAHEDDARELIGFKHINGPQAWDAYAKASYAAKWLDSQRGKLDALKLADIASRMGDKHATIHRMVTAFYVLQQAEDEELYDIDDRQKKAFSFSHLYTGLSYNELSDYIGMTKISRDQDPELKPVPSDKRDSLRNLLIWLYGSKIEGLQPVVRSQNPDLGKLRDVLSSKAAARELEERHDLDAALITATPKDLRFSRHLLQANAELQKAIEALDGFDAETQAELQEIATSASKRATIIRSSIDAQLIELAALQKKI